MLDEKTNQFLDNIIKGASNEDILKLERPKLQETPQRDLASEAIISFAPAVFGALGGESAAISQLKGGQQARQAYEAQREEQAKQVVAKNKNLQEIYGDEVKAANDRKEREQKLAAQILQSRDSNDLRRDLAIQANAARMDAKANAAQDRQDRLNAKKEEKVQQLAIPGYQLTGEVMPSVQEAQKLRDAKANADSLTGKLNRLSELVDKNGSFKYFGDAGTEMQSLATEIQLLAKSKDMYDLGVLTGPDMSLLEKITASPTSLSSLFTLDDTRKTQINTQLKSIADKLSSATKARGYKSAGDAPASSGASSGASREEMIKALKAKGY